MNELESLEYQLAAMAMAIQALIKTHPARAEFSAELRQIAGRSQLVGVMQESQMPAQMRTVLDHFLEVADKSA